MRQNHYEVIIVGAGISGAALFYTLSNFTNLKKVALLEKYHSIAPLNSNGTANSQTIHCGDIETNYTFEKASAVRDVAKMVVNYAIKKGLENKFIFTHQKMALGVGDEEVAKITARYEKFKELYPYLELFDKEKLAKIEPKVAQDADANPRKENIVAMGVCQGQYTTADFGALAVNMVDNGQKDGFDVYLNSKVSNITKVGDRFFLQTPQGTMSADYVVVDAGAHSLFLAHSLGYGKHLSALPIAGSFYFTKKRFLNGKVYMVQNDKLPFAALHGDPDILADGNTRFGPTALVLPKLERYHGLSSACDFVKSLNFDMKVAKIFVSLLKDSDIRNYVLKNFVYEIPFINKKAFAKAAQKIVPSISASDITYACGFGGVRAQVLDKKSGKMEFGEGRIATKDGIAFNMTPSPGATSCFATARADALLIEQYLGIKVDWDKFSQELESV